MPSENMIIWQICKRLSPIGEPWRKPPPFFLGLWRLLLPAKSRAILTLSSNQTVEKYGDIVLPPLTCNVNLILSVPPLTMHLKLIRGEMSYLIIFDHEHWSVARNFDFRSACPKSFLKRAKYYPEIHRSLYYLSLWKETLRGNECTSGKLKIICYETLCERWTESEERSPGHQLFAHSLFTAAELAHPPFIWLCPFLADEKLCQPSEETVERSTVPQKASDFPNCGLKNPWTLHSPL